MRRYVLILILGISMMACVEPFEPEVGEYERTLVVDGLFSDSESPSRVVLSRSFGFDEDEPEFISATVIIEDDEGGSTILTEVSPGIYETNPDEFKGEVGKSYRLTIQWLGRVFQSSWEIMKPAPPIEEVNFAIEERIPNDSEANPIPGAQFYLNTSDGEGNTRFYRWEWTETYMYNLIHPPRIQVTFSEPGVGEISEVPFEEFEGLNCWKTVDSRRIIIASTEDLSEDRVQDFPLHFVDNRTPRLYLRYSLLVKQYAISEAYYRFLRKVEEINQSTGSLFDPIPNEVFGNIQEVNDKSTPILGYFGVAGISEKRTFVERGDLPFGFGAPQGPFCQQDTVGLDEFGALYNKIEFGGRVLHEYNRTLFGAIIGYLLTDKPCASCAANDATNVQPDFW